MERRDVNLNSILGMDLRDFNIDQQKAKEIINLVKDKDGWRLRDGKLDVLTLSSYEDINAFIYQKDKIIMQIGRRIYVYAISGDSLGDLLEQYDDFLDFDFKMWKTNYPSVFFIVDTTNKKSYVLEFTDKVMTMINDSGLLDPSTELLLNEYDTRTGDLTWCGLARHQPFDSLVQTTVFSAGVGVNVNISLSSVQCITVAFGTSSLCAGYLVNVQGQIRTVNSIVNGTMFIVNSAFTYTNTCATMNIVKCLGTATASTIWNTSINRYLVNYDIQNEGLATEWNAVTLLKQTNYSTKQSRYVLICGLQSDTHVYIFDFEDFTPYRWTTHLKLAGTNVFKIDGTGTYNDKARFMDVLAGDTTVGSTETGYEFKNWETINTGLLNLNAVNGIKTIWYNSATNIYCITGDYVNKYNGVSWIDITGTGNFLSQYKGALYYVNDNQIYCTKRETFPADHTLWKYNGNSFSAVTGTANLKSVGGTACRYVSNSEIYVGTISSGIYKYNGTTFSSMASSPTGQIQTIGFVNSTYMIVASYNSGVHKYNGSWTNISTGLTGQLIQDVHWNSPTNMYCTDYGTGTAKFNGTSWSYINSGLTDLNVRRLKYISDSEIYVATNSGMFKYNGSSWSLMNTGAEYDITDFDRVSGTEMYLSTAHNGIYKQINQTLYDEFTTATFDAFIPNDDAVAKLNYNGTVLAYTVANVNLGAKSVQSIKIIDSSWSNDATRIVYGVCYTNLNTVDTYVLASGGSGTFRETVVVASQAASSGTLANAFTYTQFIGMALAENKYYELTTPSIRGYSLITCYDDSGNTRFDCIDYTTGNSTNTISMERKTQGFSIPNSVTVGYLGTTQTFISMTGVASIINTGQDHYIYAVDGMKIIRYVMTGNAMTNDDTKQIVEAYNSDISHYSDPYGIINGLVVSNPKGYVLTEINKANKTPVRPYFTADTGNVLYSTTNANNFEMFTTYEMPRAKSKASFRTPIDIDNGTQVAVNDTTGVNSFKYWLFYLLDSGLLDMTIPYINLAKGMKDPTTGAYLVKFWQMDSNFMSTLAPDIDVSLFNTLPHRFNNIDIDSNDDGLTTHTYMINGKIFYHAGSSTRDLFNVNSYWQGSSKVKFEIQDLIINNADILMALNYDKKAIYYSTGYKYLNLLNSYYFKSRPTAIEEINNNIFAVACEDNIYIGMGTSEDNIIISLLANDIGLEKDNYKSLIGNGRQAFMYNRKGVWMVDATQVVDLSPPIDQYLYKQSSDNKLGYDSINNKLYIPLDNGKMTNVVCNLYSGDYTATSTTCMTFSKTFGVLDVANMAYTIYAFTDNGIATYKDFFGNMKDHLVTRVGANIIIPEYAEADSTEQKIGRFTTKRISFGNVFSLKKLDTILAYFLNNENISGNVYGCDYLKLKFNINKGTGSSIRKYGDFDETQTYECDVSRLTAFDDGTLTNEGFREWKLPEGLDFKDIEITLEYGRLSDTNSCITTLHQITIDVINKDAETFGVS